MTIIQRKEKRATYRRRDGNWWIDTDQGYFYDPLPQVVTCDRRLSHRAKLVYSMVSGLSRQNGWCTMSQTTLAVFIGSSRDSIHDDLRCLVTAGLLEESRRLGYPNGYRPVYLNEVYGDDYLEAMRVLQRAPLGPEDEQSRDKALAFMASLWNDHQVACRACCLRVRVEVDGS